MITTTTTSQQHLNDIGDKMKRENTQVGGFLRVLRFPPQNKTHLHDITEILLKVALNTIKQATDKVIYICLKYKPLYCVHVSSKSIFQYYPNYCKSLTNFIT
jgi:hypothetical protein